MCSLSLIFTQKQGEFGSLVRGVRIKSKPTGIFINIYYAGLVNLSIFIIGAVFGFIPIFGWGIYLIFGLTAIFQYLDGKIPELKVVKILIFSDKKMYLVFGEMNPVFKDGKMYVGYDTVKKTHYNERFKLVRKLVIAEQSYLFKFINIRMTMPALVSGYVVIVHLLGDGLNFLEMSNNYVIMYYVIFLGGGGVIIAITMLINKKLVEKVHFEADIFAAKCNYKTDLYYSIIGTISLPSHMVYDGDVKLCQKRLANLEKHLLLPEL